MKPSLRNPFLRNLFAAASIGLCFAQIAHSASIYWDTNGATAGSGAATGTWGTSTFWTASEPGTTATNGTLPTANDDVLIAAGTNGTTGTITVSGARVVGSVTIQEPTSSTGVTISGGTSLTLGGGSSASKGLFVIGNAAHTVSTPLVLGGANTIQTGGTGTFTINGGITGTGDLTLRHNNTSTDATGIRILASQVNPTGAISNTGASTGTVFIGNANAAPGVGSGGIGANVTSISQDSTTSSLQLLNANNSAFAGNYNVNAGTLQFAGTNTTGTITATNASSVINLGATSGSSAATLNIVNNAVNGKVNNSINVRAGSTGTKSISVNSSVTFATSGVVTLDDNLTLNPTSGGTFGFTFNGLIQDGASGSKGLVKAGAGDATLTFANTYSGVTSVTAGNLILSGSAGALPNTSGVAISGGSFRLNNTAAANNGDRIPNSTVVTITGGTFDLKNDAAATTAFSETIALTASVAGTITTSQAAADGSSALTIGSFTRNPGATLAFTGTGLGVDARNQILFSTAPATLGGIIPWATYGTTGFASYDPTNGIVAAAATDIDAQGSTIADDSTSNLRIFADGTASAIALGAATTSINSLVQANTVVAPATIDTVDKTLRVNSILLSSAANTKGLTVGSAQDDGTLTAGTAGGDLVLINNSASALTLNAVIANNTSTSSVTKAGTGDATFAGNNTYTGATYLAGGVITATNGNAFGSGTVNISNPTKRLILSNGITLSNPIVFNGGGEAFRAAFEDDGTSPGNATLAGPITITGPLAGGGHFGSATSGSLTITGPITSTSTSPVVRLGTVIMAGVGSASNYASFNAGAGITRLGASNALLPSATLDMGSSGDSRFDLNGFNQTLAGITRSANATFIGNSSTTGDSTLTTTGTSNYSGNIYNVLTPGTMKTFLAVDSGALTLSGGFTAETATINNGGTLNISTSGGDSFNPAGRLITVNNGGVLKSLAANKVQNDTVIDVKLGGTFDENGQADSIGHITGAGSITNLNSSLTLTLPAVGSPAEFSGTISGVSTTGSALVLSCAGTGASAASTMILSGANTGLTATGTNSSVNVQGGRLIGRNSAAFGPAGQIISVGAGALTLDPTIEFGNDTALNAYVINIGSGNTGTIELNRATPGAALTQVASTPTLGNGTLNIEKGANVTSGTPTLEFPALSLSAGSGGLGAATLNPVDVNITVLGGVTRPGTSAANLKLDGTSTGNSIAGAIQDNGANKLNVTKSNTGIWTLGGLNSHTGTTTVNGGTLNLTGSLAAGSAVTVGGATASGTPTLTGAGGTVNGTLNIAAAGGGAAGTVNPDTVGTTGTLNAGATTIAGTFACDVNGANTDRIAVSGNLTLGGNLAVNEVAAGTPGTYVIASYTGIRSGTLGGTLPSGYSLNYDDANKEVELVIAAASGFGSWIGGFGLATADQDPTDDPDGDGIDNLTEFALNGDPSDSSDNGLTAMLVQDASAPTGNELTLIAAIRDGAVFASGSGGVQTATVDGVVYSIEGSTDLSFPGSAVSSIGTASEAVPAGTSMPALTDTGWEYRTFKLDASEGLSGKGFLRIKVTAAP